MRKAFYLAASLLTLEALAAPGAVKLQCGAMAGFKSEAEMKLVPSQNLNAVDLTFVGARPPNEDIDRLLRECAAVAAKRDPSRDALVSAWYRKRPGGQLERRRSAVPVRSNEVPVVHSLFEEHCCSRYQTPKEIVCRRCALDRANMLARRVTPKGRLRDAYESALRATFSAPKLGRQA